MAIPSNLLLTNASEISGSVQSLAGTLPATSDVQIAQDSILNEAIPSSLFTSASYEEIREKGVTAAENYINPLRVEVPTFTIPSTVLTFSPKLPTYGEIKNYIKTKIDRIKRQRRNSSIKALDEKLKQKENPFTYRQQLKSKSNLEAISNLRNITNRG